MYVNCRGGGIRRKMSHHERSAKSFTGYRGGVILVHPVTIEIVLQKPICFHVPLFRPAAVVGFGLTSMWCTSNVGAFCAAVLCGGIPDMIRHRGG